MKVRRFALLVASIAVAATLAMGTGCAQNAAQPAAAPAPAPAQQPDAQASKRADVLISVADLAAAPDKYFVIDARDAKAYDAGHIPGAVNAIWQSFATVASGKPGSPNWGILMSPQEIAGAAGKLGIETSKTIVVYTDPTGWGEDGRDMWTLQSIGVTNVKMLDGGYPAWVAAGKEVSRQTPTVAPTTVSVGADKLGDVNVTTEQVKQAVATSGTAVILDARAKKEYDGATDFGEARGGHIKGAVNLPYPTLFNEDGTVKSDADLESMFKAAGVTKDKPVYVYCTKGIRSAYLTELLWMLGYDKARNYDASYYSWAGDSSLPVEK